jgi:hypothetical protein
VHKLACNGADHNPLLRWINARRMGFVKITAPGERGMTAQEAWHEQGEKARD